MAIQIFPRRLQDCQRCAPLSVIFITALTQTGWLAIGKTQIESARLCNRLVSSIKEFKHKIWKGDSLVGTCIGITFDFIICGSGQG